MPDQVRRVRIETEVRGQDSVERANKIVGQFESGLRKVGEAAAAVFIVKQAFDATVHSISASTRALVQQRGAIDSLATGYRALRVAISPTLLTAGTIGAGLAVEAALRNALSRARQLERDATTAGLSGATLGSVQTRTIAGRLLGSGLPVDDAGRLAAVAREASGISDPLKKAQLALKEFGADAAVVLPFLNERTAEAVESAQRLASVLDNDTAAALARLKSQLEAPARSLRALGDEFRLFGETTQVVAAKAVANAFRLGEALAAGARAGAAGRFGEGVTGGGLPGSTGALQPFSINNPFLFERGTIQPSIDAASFLGRRAGTREGLESERSRLESLRAGAIAGFNRDGASAAERGLFAQQILSTEPQLRIVQQRLTSLRISELELADAVGKTVAEIERQGKAFADTTERMMRGGMELFQRSPLSVAGEAAEAGRRLSAAGPPITQLGIIARPIESEGQQEQLRALGAGLVAASRTRAALTRESLEREIAATSRIIELRAGPGGELAAAIKVRDLRLSIAQAEAESQQARLEFEVRTAEIIRKQQTDIREGTGRVFDALIAGGAGIRGLLTGGALTIGRTIAQNAGQQFLGGSIGKFSLPGTGTAEAPTLLGRLLSGTPFGPKSPLDQSADALKGSAVALVGAANAISSASGGGVISGIPGLGGLSLPARIFGGASVSNPFIFSAAGIPLPPGVTPINRQLSDAERVLGMSGLPSGTSSAFLGRSNTLARGIGIAGAAAGGAFGLVSGINQGGIQGGLTATSSLAGSLGGIIASIPSLAAATGPLAPILIGAALGAGAIASFFGDPKQKFAARQRRQLEDRAATGEIGQDLISDDFGSALDRDRVGNFRRTSITVNVSAIDVKSFVDHRGDITEAVRTAFADGTGNALMEDMRGRLLPA